MGALRLILALSVVVWHMPGASFHLMNARAAVVLFFIISGFYMAMVINEKYATSDGTPWIKTFYLARFWRLYPAYLALLCVMLIWFYATNSPNLFRDRLPMSLFEQSALLLSNIFIIGQDLHQFLVRVRVENAGPQFLLNIVNQIGPDVLSDPVILIGQAWSLGAEAMFYLIAPFIVRSTRMTAMALGAALVFRFLLLEVFGQRSDIWGYFFFPGAVCMFLIGSASYHLGRIAPFKEWHVRIGWAALVAFLAWFALTAIADGVVMPPPADPSIDRPRFWILYALFALSIPFIFQATKRSHFDREIGEISYPLYLVHGFVLGLVYFRWGAPKNVVPDACAAIAFSLMAAYAMHRLVELPFERCRQWLSTRPWRLTPSSRIFSQAHAPATEPPAGVVAASQAVTGDLHYEPK